MNALLKINNLSVNSREGQILQDISLTVPQGQITAIVGGSGSGKTTIINSILGLMPQGLTISQGEIIFKGDDLRKLSQDHMRHIRGRDIAMIYQEPLWAFNPLLRIGTQIDEVLVEHTRLSKQERYSKIIATLSRVQLPRPEEVYQRYPHQLSGGERQRAMIAQAIICEPSLILADEPTSNLDVTIAAGLIDTFRQLKKAGMSILLITHDIQLVKVIADEIINLKEGRIIQ